jgi:hypothetical protein
MGALISLLVLCQALGALVGAGTAIWSEFSYLRAMRDGEIDRAERAHLRVLGHGLRFGLVLLLLSSLGLVVAAYSLHAAIQPAVTPEYWASVLLALLIVYIAWALAHKRLSFTLGSTLAFTAWWFLAYLMIGMVPPLSFGAITAFFIVAAGIFYGLLQYARMLAHPAGRRASEA